MDPVAGAKAAAQTLKGAQSAGNELGQVVASQQADMERAVQEQHRKRMQEKARLVQQESMAEFKAVERYEKEKAHQQEIERLKSQVTNKHGKNAWSEIEALKLKMKREIEEEDKFMTADRQKAQDAFFWCLGAAALITYFLKLYKL
jgi:intergrase/recombinase